MIPAETLACLRSRNKSEEDVCEILRALASSFHPEEPVVYLLDKCTDAVEGIIEKQRQEVIDQRDRRAEKEQARQDRIAECPV